MALLGTATAKESLKFTGEHSNSRPRQLKLGPYENEDELVKRVTGWMSVHGHSSVDVLVWDSETGERFSLWLANTYAGRADDV